MGRETARDRVSYKGRERWGDSEIRRYKGLTDRQREAGRKIGRDADLQYSTCTLGWVNFSDCKNTVCGSFKMSKRT